MAKAAVATRSTELESIDRLEEKVKALVGVLERMKGDTARLNEENLRLKTDISRANEENTRMRADLEAARTRLGDAEGSRAELTAGLGRKTYAAVLAILAVLTVAMAGLLIRALAVGEFAGVLFILGFAALFAWQVGGFVRRNRPQSYGFDRLPRSVLP